MEMGESRAALGAVTVRQCDDRIEDPERRGLGKKWDHSPGLQESLKTCSRICLEEYRGLWSWKRGPGELIDLSRITSSSLRIACPDEQKVRQKRQEAFMDEPKNFPQSSHRERKYTRGEWKQGQVTQEERKDPV